MIPQPLSSPNPIPGLNPNVLVADDFSFTPTQIKDCLVRLTKMEVIVAEGTHYKPGYWSEGVLLNPIKIGSGIRLLRSRRSRKDEEDPATVPEAVETYGIFISSQVMSVDGDLIKTANSVWKIEEVF